MHARSTVAELLARFEGVQALNTHMELAQELDTQLLRLAERLRACGYPPAEAYPAIRGVGEAASRYMRDQLLSTQGRDLLFKATGAWAAGGVCPRAGAFEVDAGHYVRLVYGAPSRLIEHLRWDERLYGRGAGHPLAEAAALFGEPVAEAPGGDAPDLEAMLDALAETDTRSREPLAEDDPFGRMAELFSTLRLIAPQCRAEIDLTPWAAPRQGLLGA